MMKPIIFSFLLLFALPVFSQQDSMPAIGTIKIAKAKQGKVYINAYLQMKNYDLPQKKVVVYKEQVFQPFPIVEGHPYPFNYSRFFSDCFQGQTISLGGKTADTAYFELHVSAKGKAMVREIAPPKKGKSYYEVDTELASNVFSNPSHMLCIENLLYIRKWFPAYYELPQKDKYRGEVVIKPNKTNIASTGVITVIFSKEPF